MKTLLISLLLVAMTRPAFSDELENYKKNTDAIWRTGAGAEDGTFTAISTSMFGWGIALAAGIAILASVLHQSTAAHSTSHCKSD
jgi:hypothetical protein